MSKVLEQFIQEEYKNRPVSDFRVGDTVKVHQIVPNVKEDKKLSKTAAAVKKSQKGEDVSGERIQIFEGIVIARKHGTEPGATFTVRKIGAHKVGVEKIFPLYSPLITKIEVSSRPNKRPRRSKLYFLRSKTGRRVRRFGLGKAIEQDEISLETDAFIDEEQDDAEDKDKDKDKEVQASQEQSEENSSTKVKKEDKETPESLEKDK